MGRQSRLTVIAGGDKTSAQSIQNENVLFCDKLGVDRTQNNCSISKPPKDEVAPMPLIEKTSFAGGYDKLPKKLVTLPPPGG